MLSSARIIAVIASLVVLSGCASFAAPGINSPEQLLSEARGPDENRKLHTDLIREMIDQERLYAAYAHLQAQERQFGDNLELRLLRAEIQRKLGRTVEAEADYKALLETPYAGYAEHGLGLIYAQQDLSLGTKYLRRAVKLRPTDARIRNDLGYALMRQGKFDEARLHLATAFQLDTESNLNRNNYILVLLLTGDERGARQVAAQTRVAKPQMQKLREQAASFAPAAGAPASAKAQGETKLNTAVVGSGGG